MSRGDDLDKVAEGIYTPDFLPKYVEDLDFLKDPKRVSNYVSSFSGILVKLEMFSPQESQTTKTIQGRLSIDRKALNYNPHRFNLILENGTKISLPYSHIRRLWRNIRPEALGKERSDEERDKILRDFSEKKARKK
jgi:hypothetical protein